MISKHKMLGLKHYDDPKTLIEYPNDMQDVYKLRCMLNLEIKMNSEKDEIIEEL